MDKNIKKKWTKALKSDKYIQGKCSLRATDEDITQHCCLGVLCEVLMEEGYKIKKVKDGYSYNKKKTMTDDLSPTLLDKLDLSEDQQQKLIELNDDYNRSFKQIAKFIKSKDFKKLV
jgi:hypothetical protein